MTGGWDSTQRYKIKIGISLREPFHQTTLCGLGCLGLQCYSSTHMNLLQSIPLEARQFLHLGQSPARKMVNLNTEILVTMYNMDLRFHVTFVATVSRCFSFTYGHFESHFLSLIVTFSTLVCIKSKITKCVLATIKIHYAY